MNRFQLYEVDVDADFTSYEEVIKVGRLLFRSELKENILSKLIEGLNESIINTENFLVLVDNEAKTII